MLARPEMLALDPAPPALLVEPAFAQAMLGDSGKTHDRRLALDEALQTKLRRSVSPAPGYSGDRVGYNFLSN